MSYYYYYSWNRNSSRYERNDVLCCSRLWTRAWYVWLKIIALWTMEWYTSICILHFQNLRYEGVNTWEKLYLWNQNKPDLYIANLPVSDGWKRTYIMSYYYYYSWNRNSSRYERNDVLCCSRLWTRAWYVL
jgi:hypothetical protein